MESLRPAGNVGAGDTGEYKSQVKAATDIVELIGKSVLLKKRGKDYVGLCPFHSEKTPSFYVHPIDQFFYCQGCKVGGDAISFVMKRDNVVFIDALRSLGEAAGIPMPERGVSKEKAGQRKQLIDANSAAAMFFEKLLSHPTTGLAGREYLTSRGFTAETIRRFHLGLAVESWDALLKSPAMRGFSPQLLATAGLLKPRERDGSISGYYDTFRNRLMFPIRNETGQVIAFGGRVMPGSQDPAKYLNSPETPLFSKSRCVYGLDQARQKIVESRTVAIVEGYTDVVMAHQYGATNVVSVLGTSLTAGHVSILQRFAEKIVLLFDPDTAGDLAVNRAVELFLTQPIEIAIASLPDGVDPDEFLLAQGLPAFEAMLAKAQDALTYKWKQLIREFNANGDDMTGQQKAVQEYLELLANARGSGPVDSLRWGMALANVSRLTAIPVDDLNRRFRQTKSQLRARPTVRPTSNGQGAARSPGQSPGHVESGTQESAGDEPTNEVPLSIKPPGLLTAADQSERWILAVLLAQPQRWSAVQKILGVNDFKDEAHRRLAEVYWHHQRDEGEPVFSDFLSSLANPVLAELAVSVFNEFETLNEPENRLKDAITFIEEQKRRDQESKHLAALKRTSVSGNNPDAPGNHASGDVTDTDMLRKMQETARRTDLRRTGS